MFLLSPARYDANIRYSLGAGAKRVEATWWVLDGIRSFLLSSKGHWVAAKTISGRHRARFGHYGPGHQQKAYDDKDVAHPHNRIHVGYLEV
jgi:hypothetical protein